MDTGSIGRTTFGGLASGLDTNALLSGLLELERIPLNRLRSQQSEIETQRGLMRQLNTKVLALRKAAQALDNRNATGSADSFDAYVEDFASNNSPGRLDDYRAWFKAAGLTSQVLHLHGNIMISAAARPSNAGTGAGAATHW